MSASQLQSIASFLPADFKIVTIGTGNPRAAIECRLPAIKDFSDFEKARPIVERALENAGRIQSLVIQYGEIGWNLYDP